MNDNFLFHKTGSSLQTDFLYSVLALLPLNDETCKCPKEMFIRHLYVQNTELLHIRQKEKIYISRKLASVIEGQHQQNTGSELHPKPPMPLFETCTDSPRRLWMAGVHCIHFTLCVCDPTAAGDVASVCLLWPCFKKKSKSRAKLIFLSVFLL